MVSPESGNSHEPAKAYPTIWELVGEPNPAALEEQAYSHNALSGKFVRIGKLVLTAPLVAIGPREYPIHADLVFAGIQNPDQALADKVRAALISAHDGTTNEEMISGDLHDAGWYIIELSEGRLKGISLGEDSHDFGRADVAGRQRTAEAFQTYMGPDITVIATD